MQEQEQKENISMNYDLSNQPYFLFVYILGYGYDTIKFSTLIFITWLELQRSKFGYMFACSGVYNYDKIHACIG